MPLILTAQLDPASGLYFNALRIQHFPADRNFVPAHVTLFHHLPDSELPSIDAELHRAAAGLPPIPIGVSGLSYLGRGVAFTLVSQPLSNLRANFSAQWWDWLTPQDRQPYKPHITIQNKVTPSAARDTLALLHMGWQPSTIQAIGLQLWDYRGGPWELRQTFPFNQKT